MGTEAFPALDQDQNNVEPNSEDGTVGVCPVLEGEKVLKTLGADGTAETEGGETDANPGQLVRDTDNTGLRLVSSNLGSIFRYDLLLQPGPQLTCTDIACTKAKATDN